jgi:hypothetical protein
VPVLFILLALLAIEPHDGSALETVTGMARAVTVVVSLTVLVLLPANMWAEGAAAAQVSEPPRWRYLAQAACGAGCAVGGGILAVHLPDEKWAASTIAVLGLWSGIVAVGMRGRAVCWGWVR